MRLEDSPELSWLRDIWRRRWEKTLKSFQQ